ncbi:MAG: DEAD/DEAH box helicase [Proteobacteria bacterium]|nr:DEAD/DEAH box helicase [Pseudomonadota bacterium]
MTSFSDLGLSPDIVRAVEAAGYTVPTPIQEQGVPVALTGKDVLGIAQTGTGKTAAFTLPMIERLANGRSKARMPRSLVIAPTRELADQVAAAFDKYSANHKLSWALLIGGVSMDEQVKKLDRGVDVLIATPGRLLDLFERGRILLTGVQIMVVDEADRMLDMGFIPDLERIFKLTPPAKQTLFFSATMPPEITRLTKQFLKDPVRIEVSRQASTAETIRQLGARVPSSDPKAKRLALRTLISGTDVVNGIVFCNRKSEVDVVAKSLKRHGFDAAPIHGDLDQSTRTRTLEGFRAGSLKLLIASDVAARGLDIPAVGHVFNYDVPHHAEDYVHRIGRTGRAGRTGEAYTLITPNDAKNWDKVVKLIGKTPEEMTLELDDRGGAGEPRRTAEPKRDETKAEDGARAPRRARAVRPREAAREETVLEPVAAEVEATPPAAPAPAAAVQSTNAYGSRQVERAPTRPTHEGRAAYGGRDGSGREDREPKVVGFGADTPAFLLRAPRAAEAAQPATPTRRRRSVKAAPETLAEAS